MKQIYGFIAILLIAITFGSCGYEANKTQNRIQFVGEAQGTYYAITYYATDTLITQIQIDSVLTAFDLSASIWVKESIISKINNNDLNVVLDNNFIEIFKLSKKISRSTGGAFDITVSPLVNAWGFGFKNKSELPSKSVDSLMELVNFDGIYLLNNEIIKENPNIQIDYNAIAQGYSVDLIGGFLQSKGISNFLIDIGGEVLAKGKKPEGKKWVVGIEKPSEEANSERKLDATIEIEDKAIATSGNYRKFFEENGIRYSHTIDPKTGYPAKNTLLSATVMCDSAAIADGYATALMVMGLEKSVEFLKDQPQLDAYLIYSDQGNEYKTWGTGRFLKMIDESGLKSH